MVTYSANLCLSMPGSIPGKNRSTRRSAMRQRGALTTELFVAMSIIVLILLPLVFSLAQESRYFRSCYTRTLAMEIVDGEMEILLAGEWRAFKPGVQPYPVKAGAVTNLPPGAFQLTIIGNQLRLEWLPQPKRHGTPVAREARAK